MPRPFVLSLVAVLVVALGGLMAVASLNRARAQRSARVAKPVAAPTDRGPRVRPVTAPPADRPAPRREPTFAVERVRPGATVALRARPGGAVVTKVGATTQFGSPQTLTVAARHGSWVGVTTTDRPNGKLAWVQATAHGLQRHATHVSIRVDLSRRRLELRDGGRVLRTATVGIGRPGSPTPTGRFAVTDKLAGTSYGPYYGCCILALSGHQTNTPAGWQGGNRLAIHGTNDPSTIGVPSSAGCLHASATDLKVLMRRVPLGTPVFIRR